MPPPPLLSLRRLGGGWSAVSAAGGRGGRGSLSGRPGRISRRRRRRPRWGRAAEAARASCCALSLGLLARSYCPKNGPAQVFLGGAPAREGRAGEGRGWGNLARESGPGLSLAFKGARCAFYGSNPPGRERAGRVAEPRKARVNGAPGLSSGAFRGARAADPLLERGALALLPQPVLTPAADKERITLQEKKVRRLNSSNRSNSKAF
ncbi:uncharacterized protein LOC124902876 [Homo sapiens]|uniref:uncharacterized protein LOC124902876 n=1 Tax=Homo sapiens TaxID=9606 RepID=UPI0005D0252B|nr:uncharacterized protein LOC124902876 [Homo sapiens]